MAPQANLVADISYTLFFGEAPMRMIVTGCIMGTIIIIIDLVLMWRRFPFRLRVLSVSLGLYLPFENTITVWLGAIAGLISRKVMERCYPKDRDYVKKNTRFGLMFAAGIITGESLMGILHAIPVVVTGNRYLWSVTGGKAKDWWPGLVLIFMVLLSSILLVTYPAILRRNRIDTKAGSLAAPLLEPERR
jgi:hypothetical protein